MSSYNTYGGIQLKCGDCSCKEFELGEVTDLDPGVYIAPQGYVVIDKDGRLILVTNYAKDKWGNSIDALGMLIHVKNMSGIMEEIHDELYKKDFQSMVDEICGVKKG